jgi:hypothetical protein
MSNHQIPKNRNRQGELGSSVTLNRALQRHKELAKASNAAENTYYYVLHFINKSSFSNKFFELFDELIYC